MMLNIPTHSAGLFLDWGSAMLRVHLIRNGKVIDTRVTDDGASGCRSSEEFDAVFRSATDGWREGISRVMLSGMVTRKGGWVETPYLPVATDLSKLSYAAKSHDHGPMRLQFLPGLSQADPPDVIRGEEAALLGASEPDTDRLVVLPGKHSKWVAMEGSVVRSFRTFMTGEIVSLTLKQSLAGQLAEGEAHDEGAFCDGVIEAATGVPLASIFQARSRVLVAGADACGTASYLSGLFIGTEILEAMRLHPNLTSPPFLWAQRQ